MDVTLIETAGDLTDRPLDTWTPAQLKEMTAGSFTYPDWNWPAKKIREVVRKNNTRRAGFALYGVIAYGKRVKGLDSEPVSTMVQDLLSDLRHLCDAYDVNFDELVEDSERRYNEEIRGEV